MGKKRRQYTKEFKIEAVRLIIEEGRPISDVARESLGTVVRRRFPSLDVIEVLSELFITRGLPITLSVQITGPNLHQEPFRSG